MSTNNIYKPIKNLYRDKKTTIYTNWNLNANKFLMKFKLSWQVFVNVYNIAAPGHWRSDVNIRSSTKHDSSVWFLKNQHLVKRYENCYYFSNKITKIGIFVVNILAKTSEDRYFIYYQLKDLKILILFIILVKRVQEGTDRTI